MGRDFKALLTGLAGYIIIHSDQVISQFGVKCAVALVCTRWQAVFLRPSHPADLVLITSLASWTCVFHRLRFGPFCVEISLIHKDNHNPVAETATFGSLE